MLKRTAGYIDHISSSRFSNVPQLIMLFGIIGSLCVLNAQKIAGMKDCLNIAHISSDFEISDLTNRSWEQAQKVAITTYWSGENAPDSRRLTASLLWSDKALYVRFEARQEEPLVVSDHPDLSKKTLHLWDRDVCEIFLAPNASTPNKYFEFEVAPTGEWIDLRIEILPEKRLTDRNYRSDMMAAARIENQSVISGIKVEWATLGKAPKVGDRWRGNLFRCVGKDPDRGYLAWQPTMTKEPAFHVPDKFGWFEFR